MIPLEHLERVRLYRERVDVSVGAMEAEYEISSPTFTRRSQGTSNSHRTGPQQLVPIHPSSTHKTFNVLHCGCVSDKKTVSKFVIDKNKYFKH